MGTINALQSLSQSTSNSNSNTMTSSPIKSNGFKPYHSPMTKRLMVTNHGAMPSIDTSPLIFSTKDDIESVHSNGSRSSRRSALSTTNRSSTTPNTQRSATKKKRKIFVNPYKNREQKLTFKIKQRPTTDVMIDRGIIMDDQTVKRRALHRRRASRKLEAFLQKRPDEEVLKRRH